MENKEESIPLSEVWKKRVFEWQTSGESIAEWCRQKGFVYHQFIYWKVRFIGKEPKPTNNFVEIIDEKTPKTGILIESNGVYVHLSKDFDGLTLKRCLKILEGKIC